VSTQKNKAFIPKFIFWLYKLCDNVIGDANSSTVGRLIESILSLE